MQTKTHCCPPTPFPDRRQPRPLEMLERKRKRSRSRSRSPVRTVHRPPHDVVRIFIHKQQSLTAYTYSIYEVAIGLITGRE